MYKNISRIFLTVLFIGSYHIAAALISIASVKGSACPGATGEVQFIIKGNAGPFLYSILNETNIAIKSGSVAADFADLIKVTDLAKGSYKLLVNNMDYGGCLKILDFKIECCTSPPAAIVVTGSVANPTPTTGSITLDGLTAVNTFFLWTKTNDPSFKATTRDLSNLPSGEYCVKVTNGTCSETTKCFTVGNCPATLIKSLTPTGICAAGFSDGNAKVVAENGQTPYQYKWSNGVTTEQVFGLGKGAYQVTVSDAKNCISVAPFQIADRIGAITPTAKNGCGDEKGSISLTVEAQATSLGYKWQGENTGFSATTKNISNLKRHFTTLTQHLTFFLFLQKTLKNTKREQR